MVVLPEGGRHIARIVCRRCRWCAELPEPALKGLRGPRLFRALRCSACGARDAEVSIRWEVSCRNRTEVAQLMLTTNGPDGLLFAERFARLNAFEAALR
jgi:hypothetical protein